MVGQLEGCSAMDLKGRILQNKKLKLFVYKRRVHKYLHHVLPQCEVKAECGITFSARHHVKLSDDYRNRPENGL